MIRVEVGRQTSKGFFPYSFMSGGSPYRGVSLWPLLDACRKIKLMGGDPSSQIGLFRPGSTVADLVTTANYGSRFKVNSQGFFVKYKEFNLLRGRPRKNIPGVLDAD